MPPVDVFWYDGSLMLPRPEGVPAEEPLGEGENGSLFVGTGGYMTMGPHAEHSRLLPAAKMVDYERPDPSIPRIAGEDPYRNWIEACKGGEAACSNFEYAVPLTVFVNFGNVALRSGKKLEFDVRRMKITNDEAANALLTKEYRKGWELPV